MKTFKLTALFFLLFSGVFGVTVFHPQLQLSAGSKVTGYVIGSVHSSQNAPAVLSKTISSQDDNDGLSDDSLDDDDDGCFSPEKKISSQANVCTAYIPYYSLYHSDNDLQSGSCRTNFYHLPYCNFISLRVFRL